MKSFDRIEILQALEERHEQLLAELEQLNERIEKALEATSPALGHAPSQG